MRYRGFIITSTPDSGIERYDSKSSKDVVCNGYYCQIYDGDDDQYANQLDDFCIAEGHEIKDFSYGEAERGIARYVDDHYDDLVEEQQYYFAKRQSELIGRLVCWIGENESGEELYHTLSEVVGMKDDEIRAAGFTTLVPFFDREGYAQTIAEFLIDEGTNDTYSGNLHMEDGYIPLSADEKGSLFVVAVAGRNDCLFIGNNMEGGTTFECLRRAVQLAEMRGRDIVSVLEHPATAGMPLRKISDERLIDAVKISCTASTAIDHIAVYDPVTEEVRLTATQGLTTEHGIYKKHGREAFLEAAAYYSDHVNPNSIDKTIDEMESRWYDATHRQTEAEKMVEDYNNGQTILNDPDIACTDTGQAMVM